MEEENALPLKPLSANAILTYTKQLKQMITGFEGYLNDPRAAAAAACLGSAVGYLTGSFEDEASPAPPAFGGDDPAMAPEHPPAPLVEQPKDSDGNLLPPPSTMQLPFPG